MPARAYLVTLEFEETRRRKMVVPVLARSEESARSLLRESVDTDLLGIFVQSEEEPVVLSRTNIEIR